MGLRGWPHWGQYLAVDVTWLPQLSQARASGAAHSSQNFALALFSCWHFGHFIAGPEGRSEPDGPARVTSRMLDASRFSCEGQDRHRRLLRARRERPRRRCAADEGDELAAPHSITSSARASSVGGTSRPSALAVLRLITNSYLVGACTGRSPGFSPLRMRST